MEDTKPSGAAPFRVIGTRPIRHDGVDEVTGRAKYGADYSFPRMIHGKVLRSPHAHAGSSRQTWKKPCDFPEYSR
jgi:hypothetical protein